MTIKINDCFRRANIVWRNLRRCSWNSIISQCVILYGETGLPCRDAIARRHSTRHALTHHISKCILESRVRKHCRRSVRRDVNHRAHSLPRNCSRCAPVLTHVLYGHSCEISCAEYCRIISIWKWSGRSYPLFSAICLERRVEWRSRGGKKYKQKLHKR